MFIKDIHISSQTDRHTHRRTYHDTSQPLPRAK